MGLKIEPLDTFPTDLETRETPWMFTGVGQRVYWTSCVSAVVYDKSETEIDRVRTTQGQAVVPHDMKLLLQGKGGKVAY